MEFPKPLLTGRLIKRYKRFLADVELDTGEQVTAHCANPGSMMGLTTAGAKVWLSQSDNPKRKLKYSWELLQVDGAMVGINTAHPNGLVEEAISGGVIGELAGYQTLRREVKYGKNSRIDILLQDDGRPDCYVEVKNVHLLRRPGLAEFPDSVTARGAKHLVELSNMVKDGHRAVMVYLVQRDDADRFMLARDIDPAYGAAFDQAVAAGVEAIAYGCALSADGIQVTGPVPMNET